MADRGAIGAVYHGLMLRGELRLAFRPERQMLFQVQAGLRGAVGRRLGVFFVGPLNWRPAGGTG